MTDEEWADLRARLEHELQVDDATMMLTDIAHELVAEVERLRYAVEITGDRCANIMQRFEAAKAQNARLREIVRGLADYPETHEGEHNPMARLLTWRDEARAILGLTPAGE